MENIKLFFFKKRKLENTKNHHQNVRKKPWKYYCDAYKVFLKTTDRKKLTEGSGQKEKVLLLKPSKNNILENKEKGRNWNHFFYLTEDQRLYYKLNLNSVPPSMANVIAEKTAYEYFLDDDIIRKTCKTFANIIKVKNLYACYLYMQFLNHILLMHINLIKLQIWFKFRKTLEKSNQQQQIVLTTWTYNLFI